MYCFFLTDSSWSIHPERYDVVYPFVTILYGVCLLQSTQMAVCVSLSSTLLAMTPWDTRAVQRDGVPFRAWRRSCCLWSACSLVSQNCSPSDCPFSTCDMFITCVTIVSYFDPTEPNDESGANVDASKMWREDREQFNRLAKQIVRKSLGLWLSRTQTRAHTHAHTRHIARMDVYEDTLSPQKSRVLCWVL